jgi:small-conductance mechanosensitive channel/CRP-like cAMP-binding protein
MFTNLPATERAAITVVVFVAAYFATLTVGRILKRRAGVSLGLPFQLFCITVAFYVALGFYGVHVSWRSHVDAVAILLTTAFIVALIDRWLWDAYFEKKRQTPIPQFLRQVVALFIYLISLLIILSVVYHAEGQLKALLAGSGVAAIVLGFATQDLLGGIIAGIALQISKPYKVGDWLKVEDQFAEVMEVNWRSTRFRTNDGIYLDIPNYTIARGTIINLHYPTNIHAMRIRIGVDYDMPPNRVKDALFNAAASADGVVTPPPPKIFVVGFADSDVTYEIKFWLGNHAAYNDICDSIRTNIWYEFKRQGIPIPFPSRTVYLERKRHKMVSEGLANASSILRGEPLFACLDNGQLENLVRDARVIHYGRGERIIEEGAEGNSMFIVLRGSVHVSVMRNGAPIRLGGMNKGDCFGEMSLLTGERRSATIRADGDCDVLEISKEAMGEIMRDSPQCVTRLSEILASRKLEGEGILKDATQGQENANKEREYRATFLRRLRVVFEL